MRLVFTSVTAGFVEPASKDGFSAVRPDSQTMVLQSSGVAQTEPSVWFCAASTHSIAEQAGSHTKTPVSLQSCTVQLCLLDRT